MAISIAYLVLAHRLPTQLRALAQLLCSRGSAVWVHVDAKADRSAFEQALEGLSQVRLLGDSLPIWWGGFNMVDATLRLCQAALTAGADRLVLLSGMDMPIKPMEHIERTLAQPVDRIEMLELPDSTLGPDGGLGRFHWLHRVDDTSRWGLPGLTPTVLHRSLMPWLKRRPPAGLVPLAGSQWWALQASTVRQVLDVLRRDARIERYFRGCGIPDESLFQTLVRHAGGGLPRVGHGRLIVWDREPKPYVFKLADWAELMASHALFARKFDLQAEPALVDRLLQWHQQSR